LKALSEKIVRLENERTQLSDDIKTLRKKAEEKALFLECEVSVLREDLESLKQLLGTF